MTVAVLSSVSPSNNLLHKCYTINKNYGKLITGMSLTKKCLKQATSRVASTSVLEQSEHKPRSI